MKISKTILVNTSADRVWEVLGTDYIHASRWASSVYHSSARSGVAKVEDAPAAGRVCETSLGPFTETIEAFDPARRYVAYSATGDKMPGFMKGLTNHWRVTPKGPNAALVEMELEAKIVFPFNILMGPLMRLQFGSVVGHAIAEMKHFAETGQPHPRKVKADASQKAQAVRAAFVDA